MVAGSDIQALAVFLDRFLRFEEAVLQKRVESDLTEFNRLFESFSPIAKRLEELLLTTAPAYSIFQVLRLEQYETRLHTPFLAHLLNPVASHAQGRLFFDSFMKHLFGQAYNSDTVTDIQICEELAFQKGRIDILVLYRVGGQKRALIIENKIYHHDEPGQLDRYYQYITGQRRLKTGQYHFVYLTPQQQAPSSESLQEELYQQLKQEKGLFELGYRHDVEPWLERLSPFVKAPAVKETLLQYIKTIRAL